MKGFSRESSVRDKMNTNAIIRHRLFGSIQPILGPGMGCAGREGILSFKDLTSQFTSYEY